MRAAFLSSMVEIGIADAAAAAGVLSVGTLVAAAGGRGVFLDTLVAAAAGSGGTRNSSLVSKMLASCESAEVWLGPKVGKGDAGLGFRMVCMRSRTA